MHAVQVERSPVEGLTPQVVAGAQEQLTELLALLDRDGAEYIRKYARHVMTGGTRTRGPDIPSSLPREVGKLMREMVWDTAYTVGTLRR